jgi:hypothetical protein
VLPEPSLSDEPPNDTSPRYRIKADGAAPARRRPALPCRRRRKPGRAQCGRAVGIALSDLTVNVDYLDLERLLDDWRWLIGPSKRVLVSAIGDAFLQDEDVGAIHLSDSGATLAGRRP